jgi:uncharacterized membrane protein YagU involved in acid resistance
MTTVNQASTGALTVSQAVLYGGLVAGTIDAIDGVVAYGLQGLNPIQVLQYIASGMLGKSSFEGGLATAGLGTVLHYFIAFTVAAIYVVASRKIPALRTQAVLFGLSFGVLVFLVMNYIVLPNSAVAPSPFSLPMFLNGVIGHALFVGLPIGLYARRAV